LALPFTACALVAPAATAQDTLPERQTDRPPVTTAVPHMQVQVGPRVSVHDQLFRAALALPDVENRPAFVVGARDLWLPEHVAQPSGTSVRAGAQGTFGHIHADGSLHLNLPETHIREAVNARWGARHPTLDDYILLFKPQSMAELEIIFGLVIESYNHVTGRDIRAEDYLPPPDTSLSATPPRQVWPVVGEPRYHDEAQCVSLRDQAVHEVDIYDLGPMANSHICVLPEASR